MSGPIGAGRWELIRALGAVAGSPEAARAALPALGLEAVSSAEHTDVFVLNLPPYAAAYVGAEGALGGEAADRVAGFWRVMGIDPPAEPDHLSSLLGLYASLGEAVTAARRPATMAALSRAQGTLLWEHLRSWLPPYLDAVHSLPVPVLAGWAGLLRLVIDTEADRQPALPTLPLALRDAPPCDVPRQAGSREMADALTVPVRSGMILTRHRLAVGAGQAGVGLRVGERRFILRTMLEQDPAATAGWLAAEAARWETLHRGRSPADETARWWADRAGRTARALRALPPGPAAAA
ncbi:MAG TPA: molecular chaperone TorD family protein [Trebonia sp.]|jgi:TorA maturation chaperone TorD|nr:molecular chaperone TorD family protein [Trebonia sp.]